MLKSLTWLHISDIHFLPKNEWRDSDSRSTLLSHLKQIFFEHPELQPDLVFCTGDIAFGESSRSTLTQQYADAKIFFNALLLVCGRDGIPMSKDQLFVVPGNHDINRGSVNSDAQKTLFAKSTNSHQYVAEINERFSNKTLEFTDANKRLEAYTTFVSEYLPHQVDPNGHNVYQSRFSKENLVVEICGFNSAWTAAGPEDDRNLWLAAAAQFSLAARNIVPADIRIGLIHHPIDWLNQADRKVATARISSDFDFWLHGHSHDTWITPTTMNVTIGAGAIGAESSEEFGINITSVDLSSGFGRSHLYSKTITSSGWTIHPISNAAPNGIWQFPLPKRTIDRQNILFDATKGRLSSSRNPNITSDKFSSITQKLTAKLNYCLRSYSTQPSIWIEPTLSRQPETSRQYDQTEIIELDEFLSASSDRIIIAAPQFGLTCLSRQLALRAWRDFGKAWLYLNLSGVRPNKASILEELNKELDDLKLSMVELDCLIIDGGSDSKEFTKSIKILAELFPHLFLVCTYHRTNVVELVPTALSEVRPFGISYLWSLSRTQIRQVVACYNREKYVGEEDIVTARLSSDLEVLNLHRTPLNCLTLLKVSEVDFDENPVNRSEMIKRILFLIFNVDDIPTYKSRPDLKDCEFVLGFFCQQLIQRNNYHFSRTQFLSDIQRFCQHQLISLEIHVVFDVLYANNIIVSVGSQFAFKFSYWILYFAAQRMHHDAKFASYVLSEIRYAQYPEIIEFYTGIDRKKDEALQLITQDMLAAVAAVKRTCGLPDDLNPYRLDIWKATPESERAMQEAVVEGVKYSTLPDEIKDHFADINYDRSRPYNQKLANFLTEYTVASMFRIIQAAARALRNSDYASPEVKRELLSAILLGWEQASRVVLVILPTLSTDGNASFDGQAFQLEGAFSEDPAKVALMILKAIPQNVTEWFKDDIYSQKMSPLLLERIDNVDAPDLSRHELALLIIQKRPRDWEKTIQRYVAGIRKDSYYLLDTYQALRHQYKYGFASRSVLREVEHLIKMAATKHITGAKDPGIKAISKVKFKSNVVPERSVSQDDDM